jgi:hypothetical protein
LLDWRAVPIPLDAPSGTADLTLPDGTIISTIKIESTPVIDTPPNFDTSVNAIVPHVGTLMGYTVQGDISDRSRPFELTLVWQADQATDISYTVFAQLVSDNGHVLAQSDSVPALQTRPTTGWRHGEYIVDTHTVNFHADAPSGTAKLIVGLYDAVTGDRVTITPLSDFVTLRERIVIR